MNIFYTKYSEWEEDYFKYDIFNSQHWSCDISFIIFDNEIDIKSLNKYVNMKNILVLNPVGNYDLAINLIYLLKPITIFFLSDEVGNNQKWLDLQKYTNLFFRQYNHKHYNYAPNNYQIPLGYIKYFLSSKSLLNTKILKMNERMYPCSFVGTLKSDRREMCYLFNKNFNNTKIITTQTNWTNPAQQTIIPKDLFDIYSNSIFVINGRGNISLDCFRLYEAIISGAIPVIVGDINETDITFKYDNYKPKFVIGKDWNDAVILCKKLLNNNNELQKIQDYNTKWYKDKITIIQENIKNL